MAVVSTGQITIVDTNDARSISTYITASPSKQQVFSKDESAIQFTPSWMTANSSTGLLLTPKVYLAEATGGKDITNTLSNRKFCFSPGGAAITNATTSTDFVNDSNAAVSAPFTVVADGTATYLQVKGNLKDTKGSLEIFFEADFTDPVTNLITHVLESINISTVKTGTNAVYVTLRGNTSIEESTTATKNVVAVSADLVRSSGVDTTNLTYKWFSNFAATQVTTGVTGYATKYGLKTVASPTNPPAAAADLGKNLPAAGAGNAFNTLVISENAVVDQDVFRVEITDADSKTYSAYFTVYDISDPYQVNVLGGDKLQNGQGSITLTPQVLNGSSPVSNLTGWTFTWSFHDKNGKKGAFIDTAKISVAGGATITANSAASPYTITCSSITAGMFAAGSIVKCVTPAGEAFYYEVGASSVAGSVTVVAPTAASGLGVGDFALPTSTTQFVGGKLFGCTTKGVKTTSGAAQLTVTGDEIDVKGTIYVEANRPD